LNQVHLPGNHYDHIVYSIADNLHSESSGSKYNDKVNKVNQHLASLLKNLTNITFWKHRGQWRDTASLLLPDKVHLNDVGMQVYAKVSVQRLEVQIVCNEKSSQIFIQTTTLCNQTNVHYAKHGVFICISIHVIFKPATSDQRDRETCAIKLWPIRWCRRYYW